MKLIISFFASLVLGAIAFAQEESPSPAESTAPATEEKASATVESQPASSPKEAESPAVVKKAAPAVSAAPATSAKATTAAKPAAAPSGKNMSVEATIKDNETRWETSYGAHDVSVAQAVVANDFVGIYWDGKSMGKSSVISQIKRDKDTYKSAVNEKLDVHRYGSNIAVVIGTAREKGTAKDGKPFDRTFRFTDTWVQRGGQWQCVASQVMKTKG